MSSLLREEQLRREKFRQELSPSMKAEFIAGEVILHSPAKAKHLRVIDKLVCLLSTYVRVKGLGEVFTEKALICLTRNDYEPDVCFFGTAKSTAFHGETMQFPAPDFIVEVLSESTAHRDRGVKMDDYGNHGVEEYWIIDSDQQTIEQYLLGVGETKYQLALKLNAGEISSAAVVGFRIPVAALFDNQQNQLALQRLLKD
jgi:Uma2 family endonuclease